MPIEKRISMSKNNPKPKSWYDAYLKVRYKTPKSPRTKVIDPPTKEKNRNKRDDAKKRHDWKRGDFD